MKKIVEILMDLVLVFLFVLVSTSYIDSLPRYIPKASAAKSKLAKTDEKVDPMKLTLKSFHLESSR